MHVYKYILLVIWHFVFLGGRLIFELVIVFNDSHCQILLYCPFKNKLAILKVIAEGHYHEPKIQTLLK